MSRLAQLVSLAALLVACNSGIGVTDASGVGSTSSSSATSATATTATSSGTTGITSTSSAPTTSAEGTAGMTGTATTTATTTDTTASEVTTTTTGLTTTATTADASTGDPVGCVDVSADYGDCEAELGYGFDGTSCRMFSGCDCAPNCEHFAPDPVGCASACAAAGHCEESKIKAVALAMDPVQVGSFCDGVDACAAAGSEGLAWLTELFPGLTCEASGWCKVGDGCHVQYAGRLDADVWTKLCAASLLPGAELYCVVYGP